MGFGPAVQGTLGVDTSQVPKDLEKAKAEFDKFGKEVEKKGKEHGENAGGKLVEALGHKLSSSHHLAGALSTALGLNLEKLAEGITGAIVGGSKEGWKKAGELAEENSKIIEKIIEARLSPKQLQEKHANDLTRAVTAANDVGKEQEESKLHDFLSRKLGGIAGKKFGSDLLASFGYGETDAEKLEKRNKADSSVLEAQAKVEEEKKQTKEQLLEISRQQEDSEEKEGTLQERQEKVALRINRIQKEIEAGDLTAVEVAKKKVELQQKFNELDELIKKQDTEELAKNAALLALEEKRFALAEKTTQLGKDQAKITDRAKLTIGELADIHSQSADEFAKQQNESEKRRKEAFTFGADVDLSPEQQAAREKARQVQDLEKQAEAARLAGNSSQFTSLSANAASMRDDLVAGGFAKSTEGDPIKDLKQQIAKDNEGIKTLLTQIATIESGKYVNAP